jgi:ketosteroid isomerase-like protein
MRKLFTIVILAVLSVSVLNAQQAGLQADANPVAQGEIKSLETKLAELIVRGDWDEYASHLASGYIHTRENGNVENKEEALATLHDIKRKIIVMEIEPASLAIHIYGDTAVSSAEFTITVRESGQVKGRRTRLTDVFLKRDGQWWLVAEQGVAIGK